MSQRIEWIDTAKMLTMFLVIIGHSNYYHIATSYGGIYYSDSVSNSAFSLAYRCFCHLVTFIYTFHMPLFMALSGMLFSISKKKDICFTKLAKDKAIRLLVPFFAVSLMLSIPLKYLSGYWIGSNNIVSDIACGQMLLMGNSHLWFIVALFWIFLIYFYIESLGIQKRIVFWIVLILLSWIGWYIEPKNNFLGLPAAMKHLFFFAVGFSFLPKMPEKKMNIMWVAGGMGGSLAISLSFTFLRNHYPNVVFLKMLTPILFTLFALTGIYLMCLLSQILSKYFFKSTSKSVSLFKNNTYELYLYSDPFNYLLIYIGWIIWDKEILIRNDLSIAMFLIRVFCTTLFAIITIYAVRFVHLKNLTKTK